MQAVLKETRATLLLAIPIVIGQLSQMLMGVTDSVMIGRPPLAAAFSMSFSSSESGS